MKRLDPTLRTDLTATVQMVTKVFTAIRKVRFSMFIHFCFSRYTWSFEPDAKKWFEYCLDWYLTAVILITELLFCLVNPCESSPCKNWATCVAEGETYVCHCSGGYKGSNCEEEGELVSLEIVLIRFDPHPLYIVRRS